MSTPSRLLAAVAALLLAASTASAQPSASVAAGAVVPLADFATVADPGPAVVCGVWFEARVPRLSLGIEVSYGRAGHSFGDARSDVFGLMGIAAYTLTRLGALEIVSIAGLGGIAHARRSNDFPGLDATRTGAGATLGLRTAVRVGRLRAFASGSYLRGMGDVNTAAFPTELVIVTAGVAVPFGG